MRRQARIREQVLSSYQKVIRGWDRHPFDRVPNRLKRRCLAMNHRLDIVMIRIRMTFEEQAR
jgi:hypothetical protein